MRLFAVERVVYIFCEELYTTSNITVLRDERVALIARFNTFLNTLTQSSADDDRCVVMSNYCMHSCEL
jgi:hypothetical protein